MDSVLAMGVGRLSMVEVRNAVGGDHKTEIPNLKDINNLGGLVQELLRRSSRVSISNSSNSGLLFVSPGQEPAQNQNQSRLILLSTEHAF